MDKAREVDKNFGMSDDVIEKESDALILKSSIE